MILAIENDKVVLCYANEMRPITSQAHLDEMLAAIAAEHNIHVDQLPLYYSSSMDFPEDHTDNAETIALACALRS